MVSAIQYIHSYDLVHRDIKLDNILVFKSDFSRIKLCDFGETRKNGSWVTRRNEWIPYMPPEILAIDTEQKYKYVVVGPKTIMQRSLRARLLYTRVIIINGFFFLTIYF